MITVEFVGQNRNGHTLKLFWAPPGAGTDELIPAEAFYHDKKIEPGK